MNLFESKVTAIIGLGVGSFLAGIIPLCIVRHDRQRSPLFLSALLCCGGGVLLATSLVHILPEFRESIPHLAKYAEVIFSVGFFLLYIIDEIVHLCYGNSEHSHGHGYENHHHRTNNTSSSPSLYGATERDPILAERPPPYNPYILQQSGSSTHSISCLTEERPPSQLCHVGHEEPCTTVGPAVTFGLLIALSVHALLEGLVVGLQDAPTKVLLLLGAIATHKLVVSFCLGMELASNPDNSICRTIMGILIFTLGSIGGIAGGILIPNNKSDVIPILQGLAGGTLLYVTVSEVVPRERARWHQEHKHKYAGIIQFMSVLAGFIFMTCLTLYLDLE